MRRPTLTLGATVLTLPHPSNVLTPARDIDKRVVQRRTLAGLLRTTILHYGYVYELAFAAVPTFTYTSLVDLWLASITAGTYPLFDYRDAWSTAAGVSVAVRLSTATKAGAFDPDLVSFTLTLEEASSR